MDITDLSNYQSELLPISSQSKGKSRQIPLGPGNEPELNVENGSYVPEISSSHS